MVLNHHLLSATVKKSDLSSKNIKTIIATESLSSHQENQESSPLQVKHRSKPFHLNANSNMSISYNYSLPRDQESRQSNSLSSSTNVNTSTEFISPSTGSRSTPQRRIRKPHSHDVLCGRGGGINSHPGNIAFRNWVRERKEAYNLAQTKVAKTTVSREIVERVSMQNPPGRFLQREEAEKGSGMKSSPFWVEIDDLKAMAKTSQALREGAPAIRAKAKGSTEKKHLKQTEVMQMPQPQAKPENLINEQHARRSNNVGQNYFVGSTRPRSTSIDMEEETERSPRRQKVNSQEMTSLPSNKLLDLLGTGYESNFGNFSNAQNNIPKISMTEEEKMEKIALSSIPLLHSIPIIPTAPQANVDVNANSTNKNEVSLDSTPNLLPVPDSSDPPILNSFPLPTTSLSSEPLEPIFATFRSFAGDRAYSSPKNENVLEDPGNSTKKKLIRNHSLALSDLPEPDSSDQSYLHQEPILNEYSPFNDPFQNEDEDHLAGLVEGNPDFSATRISTNTGNAPLNPLLRTFSLTRMLSNSKTRSTSMSLLENNAMNSDKKNKPIEEKKSVCFCFCDGHGGVCKELCPCTHLANSLLTGELRL